MSTPLSRAKARLAKRKRVRNGLRVELRTATARVRQTARVVDRLKPRPAAPRLITARDLGLTFRMPDGFKGAVTRGAGHYSAGERADTDAELIALVRSWHRHHQSIGGSGVAYEAIVGDHGTIAFGNPMTIKSRAVALNNTGTVSICCPGGEGDRMAPAAKASVRWLLDNWHTAAVPEPHRLPRPARSIPWRGHKEFPNNSTACPGVMLADYRELWR